MLKKLLLAAAAMTVAVMGHAADGEKTVRDAFASLLPNAKIDRVTKSDLPNFYEVIVGGQVVYVCCKATSTTSPRRRA